MTCPCFAGLCVGLNVFFLTCLPAGRRKGNVNTVLVERVEMRGYRFVSSKVRATQRDAEEGIVR